MPIAHCAASPPPPASHVAPGSLPAMAPLSHAHTRTHPALPCAFTLSAKAKIGSHYSKAGSEVLPWRAAARSILAARAILEPLAQMVAVTRGENSRRSELAPKALQDKLLSLSKEFPLLSEEERKQLREEMEELAMGSSNAGAGGGGSSSSASDMAEL